MHAELNRKNFDCKTNRNVFKLLMNFENSTFWN